MTWGSSRSSRVALTQWGSTWGRHSHAMGSTFAPSREACFSMRRSRVWLWGK